MPSRKPYWPKRRGASIDVHLVRNGSRGMLWLEPLVEVQTAKGRVAYGPVSPEDVAALFDADFHNGGKHALGLGLTEEIGVPEEPGAADLCARRHHRSAVAGGLSRA